MMLETQLHNLNADSVALGVANERIRELQSRLEAARETFTEKHPSVKRLEEQLAMEKLSMLAASQGDRKEALNLETEMRNLNLQMAEKEKQAAEIQRQIGAYQLRIESGPLMEARYAALLQRLRELTGNVQLSVTFGADGRPEKIEVIRGQGAERAIDWAKGLRFVPPDGKTAVVTVEVPVNK
jgi:outer membrane biosynthesis protein TonB